MASSRRETSANEARAPCGMCFTFMQPAAAGGRIRDQGWLTAFDEAGRWCPPGTLWRDTREARTSVTTPLALGVTKGLEKFPKGALGFWSQLRPRGTSMSSRPCRLITFGITALPLSGATFASSLSPGSNAAPKHFPSCKNLKWSYDVFIR